MTVLKKTAGWILGLGLLAGMMIFFPSLTKAATSGDYEYRLRGDGTADDYKYTVQADGTAEITGYIGTASDLVVPGNMDGINVTSIGESAFEGCSWLTSITIPSSVTEIKNAAFQDCPDLKDVYYIGTEQEKMRWELVEIMMIL